MLIGHSWADSSGTILQIDEPVADLLQRRRSDIEGKSYLSITHPADRNRSAALVSSLQAGAGPTLIRKRYVTDEGSEIWVALHTARIGLDDATSHFVGTFMVNRSDEGPRRLWQQAMRLIETYQLRREILGDQLFADHAWIIILYMYLAEAEGRVISISEISQQSKVSRKLLDRWAKAVQSQGMISRVGIGEDDFELTQDGMSRLENLLSRTSQARG